jgi:hypothetical protein
MCYGQGAGLTLHKWKFLRECIDWYENDDQITVKVHSNMLQGPAQEANLKLLKAAVL